MAPAMTAFRRRDNRLALVPAQRLDGQPGVPQAARDLAIDLDEQHDVVLSVNEIAGANWPRVSAAIYNELADCEALLAALALPSTARL